MNKPRESSRLRVLDIEIDVPSGTVWRQGEVLDLPDLSFRLLLALADRAPAMASKDELVASVWGDVVVSDETLMQRVRLLRQALGDDAQDPRYIGAVRGRGYRLLASVESAGGAGQGGADGSGTPRALTVAALAVTLLAVLTGAWLFQSRDVPAPAGPAPIERLAVLPFDDLSEEPRYGYLADGMQEELLAQLSRLDGVQVLSRSSVERYRDGRPSLPEMSRALGAKAIIEGSVRVSGDRLRITVQLIDGATDEHLWAEAYDRRLTVENLFDIQQTVAERIAESLAVEYAGRRHDAGGLPTRNTEAYEFYLLGRYHTYRLTPDDLYTAVDFLERAVALDPEFAEAYAALGWAWSFLGTRYGTERPGEVFPRAREAALRALELDDRLADAHGVYGDILTWYEWDFDLAEVEYRRTIALDPTNLLSYALFLSVQQRHEEAIALVNRQLASVPGNEFVLVNLGWRLLHAGRIEDALTAVEGIERHADAATIRGYALIAMGKVVDARELFAEVVDERGRSQVLIANLAIAEYRSGNRDAGDALLAEIEAIRTTEYVSPFTTALVLFSAGDEDRGYDALNEAVDTRARDVIFTGVHPLLTEQRDDPRLQAVLARIGLPLPGFGR